MVDAQPQGWFNWVTPGSYTYADLTTASSTVPASNNDAEETGTIDFFGIGDGSYIAAEADASNGTKDSWFFNNPMSPTVICWVPFSGDVNVYNTFKRNRNLIDRISVSTSTPVANDTENRNSNVINVNGAIWFQLDKDRWITPHADFNQQGLAKTDDVIYHDADQIVNDSATISAAQDTPAYDTPYILDQRQLGHNVAAGTTSINTGNGGIVSVDGQLWGQTEDGEWFTNHEYYQSGSEMETYDRKDNPITLPVLAYHDISDNPESRSIWAMPVAQFKEEMDWLNEMGYHTLTIDETYAALRDNTLPYDKCVTITFDDGYAGWNENVASILKSNNQTAIFFKISKGTGYDYTAAKDLSEQGFAIGGHTSTHLDQSTLPYWNQETQYAKTITEISEGMGGNVTGFDFLAYPEGGHNYLSWLAAKNAGYKMAFLYNNRIATAFSNDQEKYEVSRVRMESSFFNTSGNTLLDKGNKDQFIEALTTNRPTSRF